MTVLFKSDPARGAEWKRLFAERAPEIPFRVWPDIGDPAAVRVLVAWVPPDDIAETFPNLEVLFSSGMGVDQFDLATLPPHLPVVRMVERGIVDGMVEYAAMAVTALHRDLFAYQAQQRLGTWAPIRVRPAGAVRVGVLGLGVLGQAVSANLARLGYDVAGWNRSERRIDGVAGYYGRDALPAFLGRTDILICLLPLTAETRGILDADLLSRLPRGAKLVNVARGGHLDQAALLAALDSGQISQAILDVTDPEPLPAEHPFWAHPRVLITPHIASMTQPETAVAATLENLRRHRAGEPMVGVVDRRRGY